MKIDGGCRCGYIRYEADIDPETVAICHCTDCQTLSGSAFRTVVPAKKSDFRLLGGTPKIYVKTAGKRQPARAGLLPGVRYPDLLCGAG